jgi:hypothetical protein
MSSPRLHRVHREPDAVGSWLAWGAVGLVVAWALWWISPAASLDPSTTPLQLALPLVVQVVVASVVGLGLWRGRVPATAGQLALLVLGAALTMQALALLLVVFPPA